MHEWFFRDVTGLIRVMMCALLTYISVVAFVRITGKRSTSQLNNFDWVVTVAIGSIVGSTIVISDLPLLEGILAIASLLIIQFAVTKTSLYAPAFSHLVRASPTILFYQGHFVSEAMVKERVTEQEILAAMRESGVHSLADVEAVVLESDARFSILRRQQEKVQDPESATLAEVANFSRLDQDASSTSQTSGKRAEAYTTAHSASRPSQPE